MKPIYLDHNATTPIAPEVAEAMLPFIHEHFGNPSSGHGYGKIAKEAVEKARRQVAQMLHCLPEELIFTSGGTESNNHAIKGAAWAHRDRGNHIITSSIEHPAVAEVCHHLAREGFQTTFLPVNHEGLVDPEAVKKAITPRTILVTIMHANNEVGTIQPIGEIARIAREHGILSHTDAAQSIGKIPVHVDELGVDLLSVAGHKLYAPKGIGALYIRGGVQLEKFLDGAGHEMHRRAGTENVIHIAGLGEASSLVEKRLSRDAAHFARLRDRLEKALEERFPDLRVNGHREKRLPNTTSVSFKGQRAEIILSRLSGVAASAGSACHSDRVVVSSVLQAMQVPLDYALGTLRLSVGRSTTTEEVDAAVEEIIRVMEMPASGGNTG